MKSTDSSDRLLFRQFLLLQLAWFLCWLELPQVFHAAKISSAYHKWTLATVLGLNLFFRGSCIKRRSLLILFQCCPDLLLQACWVISPCRMQVFCPCLHLKWCQLVRWLARHASFDVRAYWISFGLAFERLQIWHALSHQRTGSEQSILRLPRPRSIADFGSWLGALLA